MTKKNRKR